MEPTISFMPMKALNEWKLTGKWPQAGDGVMDGVIQVVKYS